MFNVLTKPKIAGKERIISYYDGLFDKHGDSHLTLDWNSKASQELRYAVLMEIIGYSDKKKDISILDVGCGIGHLCDYLKKKGLMQEFKLEYSGIDISEKLIDFAKQKNREVGFRVVDLLDSKFVEKYDYVMGSGLFGVRMADLESHKESVFKMLSRMFGIARKGVAVNFICRETIYLTSGNDEDNRYVYFTPEEVIKYCKALTNKYILRHDYHPGDFTVFLFK